MLAAAALVFMRMCLADMHAFADAMMEFHNNFTCFDWEGTWASLVVGDSIAFPHQGTCLACMLLASLTLNNNVVLLLLLIGDSRLQDEESCT